LGISRHQRLPFHRPAERLCHGGVEVRDQAFDPLLEVPLGREVAAAEEFTDQDRKPDLDLVDPARMLGCEVEGDAMTGIDRRTCPEPATEQTLPEGL
jgi:hypothetical protein